MASLFVLGAALVSPLAGAISTPAAQQKQEGPVAKADRLEAVAMALLEEGEVDTWEQVAELLEKAARHRPETSFRRAKNLRTAANLFSTIGATERARKLFEEAAEQASDLGELTFAAHAYVDAAVLSAQLKMGRHTIRATQRAEELAASPEMSRTDRLAVESRIERLGLPTHLAEIL
jgi:hypothetical protein